LSENETPKDLSNNYSDTEKIAILTAQLADDKKAQNIVVMDLREVESSPSDLFVIASCDNPSQSRAVFDAIMRSVKDYRLKTPKTEGLEGMEWIIVDFFDVVVHIMLDKIRDFYKLEKLWGDAKFYTVDDEGVMHPKDYLEVLDIYSK
jgi:ribosome-associated protein